MSDDELPDRPWNEEQWERFMKQSDARADKFGELLETLQDDPNADEIIAHEMGWDRPDEDDDEEEEDDEAWDADDDEAEDDDEGPFGDLDISEEDLAEAEEMCEAKRAALKSMPVYTRSFAFGLALHEAFKPYSDEEADDDEGDDDLLDAVTNGFTVAAKIAGAHGMGYDDDVLCGNIVCCKRALDAARKCCLALGELRRRGVVPAVVVDPLLAEGQHIVGMVEEHIAELRSRVWWA